MWRRTLCNRIVFFVCVFEGESKRNLCEYVIGDPLRKPPKRRINDDERKLSIDLPPPHICVLWNPARGLKLEQRWCFQIICLPGVGTDIIRSQWTPYQAFHQDIRTHVSESRFAWRGVFPPTCQKTDRRGFLCKQRVCHTRPYPASCSLPLHEISNMGSRHMKAAPRQYCTNSARWRGASWKTLASKS